MSVRSQVSLDPVLQGRARERAASLGISFAEYVRRLVARDLEEPEGDSRPDVSEIFDLGDSGSSDVARDKDRMIGEAVAAGKGR